LRIDHRRASCKGEYLLMAACVVTHAVNGKQYIGAATGKSSFMMRGRGAPTAIVFVLPDGD